MTNKKPDWKERKWEETVQQFEDEQGYLKGYSNKWFFLRGISHAKEHSEEEKRDFMTTNHEYWKQLNILRDKVSRLEAENDDLKDRIASLLVKLKKEVESE